MSTTATAGASPTLLDARTMHNARFPNRSSNTPIHGSSANGGVLGKGSTSLPADHYLQSEHDLEHQQFHTHRAASELNFIVFLRRNYLSFGLFLCLVISVFMIFIYAAIVFAAHPGSGGNIVSVTPFESAGTASSSTTKSIDQLFTTANSPPPPPTYPPPPPPPPQTIATLSPPQKTYDTLFRMSDGVAFDENTTYIRIFDLGQEMKDMDMVSIVFFTCCCNDKSIVVCDSRGSNGRSAMNIHELVPAEPPSKAVQNILDYSVSCYLAHDPTIPPVNTATMQYDHHWKLIVQFGPAFERTSLTTTNTDCVFSTVYYTRPRALPPPPNPPPNDVVKKIW